MSRETAHGRGHDTTPKGLRILGSYVRQAWQKPTEELVAEVRDYERRSAEYGKKGFLAKLLDPMFWNFSLYARDLTNKAVLLRRQRALQLDYDKL